MEFLKTIYVVLLCGIAFGFIKLANLFNWLCQGIIAHVSSIE